jgi:hypothetical protein
MRVRKAALAGGIFAVGLAATALWVASRDESEPIVTTDQGEASDPSNTAAPPSGEATTTTRDASAVDGPALTVSDREVAPGDVLTVRGDGCGTDDGATPTGPVVGAWSVHVWFSPAAGTVEWDQSLSDPVAIIDPDADGSWSTTITVPEWHTEYRLEAACFDEASPPHGFVYRHERVVAT